MLCYSIRHVVVFMVALNECLPATSRRNHLSWISSCSTVWAFDAPHRVQIAADSECCSFSEVFVNLNAYIEEVQLSSPTLTRVLCVHWQISSPVCIPDKNAGAGEACLVRSRFREITARLNEYLALTSQSAQPKLKYLLQLTLCVDLASCLDFPLVFFVIYNFFLILLIVG